MPNLVKWPYFRATFDLDQLEALSDIASVPLVVSERTLYVLQNLAEMDVADGHRYVDFAYELSYAPPEEGEERYGLFLTVADKAALELREVSMWEPGDIKLRGVDTNPGTGPPYPWLKCDGTAYPILTYPGLFAAIGTTFGAQPPDQFKVPNFGGKSPQGDLGSDGVGDEVGTLLQTLVPQHRHGIKIYDGTGVGARVGARNLNIPEPDQLTEYTGEAAGVDQRGPRLVVCFWIKT